MLTLQYTEYVIFAEREHDMEPCNRPEAAAEGLLNEFALFDIIYCRIGRITHSSSSSTIPICLPHRLMCADVPLIKYSFIRSVTLCYCQV